MKIPTRKPSPTPANVPGTKIPGTRKKSVLPPQIKQSGRSVARNTRRNSNNPSRAKSKRRIDASTIAAIARLVAKQLSESEACHRLGIKPQQWFTWKSRHNRSEKFAELLEAFRADRIDSLIERIEKSADGKGGVKYPDWRAALALLKIADMKRFGDTPATGQPQQITTNNTVILIEAVKRAYAQVLSAEPSPAALPPATTDLNGDGQPESLTNDSKPVETVSVFTDIP